MPTALSRLRCLDFQSSRGPQSVGLCGSDLPGCCAILNAAQERLVAAKEVGSEGWWGCWAEVVFQVSRSNPYLTLPRGCARVEYVTVCNAPVPVQNQFYEFARFGEGRKPNSHGSGFGCGSLHIYDRGIWPTFTDLVPGNRIRVYPTNVADETLRTLISGKDTNDATVDNLDGQIMVDGEYLTFQSPFTTTITGWNSITGIQKDVTIGPVSYYQVDATTGDPSLMLTMEPGETVAGYRRYYIDGLPSSCCSGTEPGTAQVTALVKLEPVTLRQSTDYLVIQSLEALIAECQSIRLSEMDGQGPKVESRERHNAAIRLLNGQLVHQLGKDQPAVSFSPFGSARLNRLNVSMK